MNNKTIISYRNATIFFFYCIISIIDIVALHSNKAVVVVPIADLLCNPIRSLYPSMHNIKHYYQTLPYCTVGKIPSEYACPRMHQLIFNEIVEVCEQKGSEVCVKIPHIFYVTEFKKQPHVSYWTLKRYLRSLNELMNAGIDIRQIPSAINFNEKTDPHKDNIITLRMPWHDLQTNTIFSAGTRFVKIPAQESVDSVSVYLLDAQNMRMSTVQIPWKFCLEQTPTTPDEQINLFVAIIRSWVDHPGIIPYVWGGCSFTIAHNSNHYIEQQKEHNHKTYNFYIRPIHNNETANGFDCAGLIARAAQIAGIPYFFKNTRTIAHYLKPKKTDEPLQEGDLLWIPGHVMIVANLANNTLIEARSYDHGYGKIQEIKISQEFKGINTYEQLYNALSAHQALERLNAQGTVIEKIFDYKILNMKSIWELKRPFS